MSQEFNEEQKFLQWWLWLAIIIVFAAPLIIAVKEYSTNPDVFQALATPEIAGTMITTALVVTLFLILKLATKIDRNGVEMHFFPFVKKNISWTDIQSAHVVNYGFVGGWGIRFFTKYGTVYNVRGNKGLAITLKSGKKFLIGTQKEAELRSFIENLNK